MAKNQSAQAAENAAEQAGTTTAGTNAATEETAVQGAQGGAGGVPLTAPPQFVYIGPTLPNGKLKEGAILEGSMGAICEFYAEVLEEYPQVKRLLIPLRELGMRKTQAMTPGNILHKYYKDVGSLIQSKQKQREE